jgi:hypothetical protein
MVHDHAQGSEVTPLLGEWKSPSLTTGQKRTQTEMMDTVLVLSNEQHAARTKQLCTSTVAEHFQPPLAMSDVCPGDDRFFHTISNDCQNDQL